MASHQVSLAAALALLLIGGAQASGGMGAAASGPTQGTTYAMLAPYRGQWAITMQQAEDGEVFVPVGINNDTSVTTQSRPLLNADNNAAVRFEFTLKDEPLSTWGNLSATGLIFKACYSSASTADRPWRKPNAVIDKDKSCPFIIGSGVWNATATYSRTWKVPENATLATLYPAVYVQCQNGSLISFCQTDSTQNVTYVATTVIEQTPTPMIIATGVCAALGPLILGLFFAKDMFDRRKV